MNRAECPAAMPVAPVLGSLQLAWLEELGLERRLLTRYAVKADPAPVLIEIASEPEPEQSSGRAAVQTENSNKPAVGHRAPQSSTKASEDEVAAARGLLRSIIGKKEPVAPKLSAAAGEADRLSKQAPKDMSEPGTIAALRHEVMVCQACALHKDRSTDVFGGGNEQSPAWLVIGEAPSHMDERVGEPFQGRSGKLLHAMLKAAGADVSADVFFTNVVKCRPIGNRPPVAEEVAQCGLHLRSQIALLQPERILALGRVAACALTGQDQDLEALRAQIWQYSCVSGRQIPVVATYHPGWLLTHPQHKAGAWEDLKLARGLDRA